MQHKINELFYLWIGSQQEIVKPNYFQTVLREAMETEKMTWFWFSCPMSCNRFHSSSEPAKKMVFRLPYAMRHVRNSRQILRSTGFKINAADTDTVQSFSHAVFSWQNRNFTEHITWKISAVIRISMKNPSNRFPPTMGIITTTVCHWSICLSFWNRKPELR